VIVGSVENRNITRSHSENESPLSGPEHTGSLPTSISRLSCSYRHFEASIVTESSVNVVFSWVDEPIAELRAFLLLNLASLVAPMIST
jgi:hypothetical protein